MHAKNFNEYIKNYPDSTQVILQQLRTLILKISPEAREVISYGMPAFTLQRNLVYFAAFKNHIGFYPGAATIAAFQNEISVYKNAKGSVQFPLNLPLPVDLITKMINYKINILLLKSKGKNK